MEYRDEYEFDDLVREISKNMSPGNQTAMLVIIAMQNPVAWLTALDTLIIDR